MAIKYLVEGLIPEGVTLLTGPGMSGKSLFALQVAVAKSNGTEVLGKPVSVGQEHYGQSYGDAIDTYIWIHPMRGQHKCQVLIVGRDIGNAEFTMHQQGYLSYTDHTTSGKATDLSEIACWLSVSTYSSAI